MSWSVSTVGPEAWLWPGRLDLWLAKMESGVCVSGLGRLRPKVPLPGPQVVDRNKQPRPHGPLG